MGQTHSNLHAHDGSMHEIRTMLRRLKYRAFFLEHMCASNEAMIVELVALRNYRSAASAVHRLNAYTGQWQKITETYAILSNRLKIVEYNYVPMGRMFPLRLP
jgi:hypothetical protein